MKLIKLTQGKQTMVDDSWYDELNRYKWFYHNGYAFRNVNGKGMAMHRIINDTPDGMQTDHIDQNGLNNQSSNLRSVTNSQNSQNKGTRSDNKLGVKGVRVFQNKYRAEIMVKGKHVHLGLFDEIDEAERAYKTASRKYYGEYSGV